MPTAGHSQNSQKSDPGLCGLGNPLPNQSHLRDHTVRNILQRLSLQELHPPKANVAELGSRLPRKAFCQSETYRSRDSSDEGPIGPYSGLKWDVKHNVSVWAVRDRHCCGQE